MPSSGYASASSYVRRTTRRLRKSQIGGLASDSGSAAIWQLTASGAYLIQIVLVTHILGLVEYGRIAIAIAFVTLVGQFFDLRVGIATIALSTPKVESGDYRGAAGIFQASYLVAFAMGLVSFVIVAAIAPFVGPSLVGPGGTLMIILYAGTLITAAPDDPSLALLRVLDRFWLIAAWTVPAELIQLALAAAALLVFKTATAFFAAMLIGTAVGAVINLVVAVRVFH